MEHLDIACGASILYLAMKRALLRIVTIIVCSAVSFWAMGGWLGTLAVVPHLLIVVGFCALIVGRYARAKRGGWSLLTHRLIGVPMLVGYAALLLYGLYKFFLSQTPAELVGWLSVTLLAWLMGYLVWKIFIFPKYPPPDDGGNRPQRPRPTRGPGGLKIQPVRDHGATVLSGISSPT